MREEDYRRKMKAKRRYLYDIILVVALLALFLSLFFFFYEKKYHLVHINLLTFRFIGDKLIVRSVICSHTEYPHR